MAGYIVTKSGQEFVFHVGDKVNFLCPAPQVEKVQLDGDELYWVKHHFNNVPVNVQNRVNVWRGDMARFIIENW